MSAIRKTFSFGCCITVAAIGANDASHNTHTPTPVKIFPRGVKPDLRYRIVLDNRYSNPITLVINTTEWVYLYLVPKDIPSWSSEAMCIPVEPGGQLDQGDLPSENLYSIYAQTNGASSILRMMYVWGVNK
jgi:hypothetical protein